MGSSHVTLSFVSQLKIARLCAPSTSGAKGVSIADTLDPGVKTSHDALNAVGPLIVICYVLVTRTNPLKVSVWTPVTLVSVSRMATVTILKVQ